MASSLRLVDFVLLSCNFSVVGRDDDSDKVDAAGEAEASASASASGAAAGTERGDGTADDETKAVEGTLELEGVSVSYSVTEEDEEFVLILHTTLTDPTAPYELAVVTGSRYSLPDPPATPEEAAATLVFVTYPYVREIFSNVTARSPFQTFVLPPLTKLPHPRVTGEADTKEPEQ